MTTELMELLREALPFVDTCPDLVRPGGDELAERITHALASRAGGWRTIDSAPRDRLIMIAGGTFSSDNYHDLPQKCATIAYWYRDHWRGDDMPAHDDWKMHKPTHWQPLPEPPAAPEPVGVGADRV